MRFRNTGQLHARKNRKPLTGRRASHLAAAVQRGKQGRVSLPTPLTSGFNRPDRAYALGVMHTCTPFRLRSPLQNLRGKTYSATPPPKMVRAIPKRGGPVRTRDTNKAEATLVIKRETDYRHYWKDDGGSARKRHNGASRTVRRVNHFSAPGCHPGSFPAVGLQPFERVRSRPRFRLAAQRLRLGRCAIAHLSPSCVNIGEPENIRRVSEPDAGFLPSGWPGAQAP